MHAEHAIGCFLTWRPYSRVPGDGQRYPPQKMSFYTPEFGIKHYNDIPTICSGCGVHAIWTDLTQKAKERLIEASSFYSLNAELVLLKR